MISLFYKKQGDTLISIIIWVVLLGIVWLGIMNLLTTNYEIEDNYNRNNTLFILKNNATNIIRKIDTSSVSEWDVFFLYKNSQWKAYQILTGTGNEAFKYINSKWETVINTWTYIDGIIYTRSFYSEKKDTGLGPQGQVIRAGIKELIRK